MIGAVKTKNIYREQYKENADTLKSKFESFESAIRYFRGKNGKNKVDL